jgi:hypothetical protein
LVFVIGLGVLGIDNAYAHKAMIVGDYKLDVGWKTEPPIANESNQIEIIFSIASDFDKQRFESVSYDSSSPVTEDDLKGLANDLEVDIKVGNGKKVFVDLAEDPENSGTYLGEYTPVETGLVKIHIYGIIKGSDFEATFHPEKVEEGSQRPLAVSIPDWIRNNAKWWSEGSIQDSDFVSGIQYLIKNDILQVPVSESSSDGVDTEIPSWIKNNAGWWADGLISDDDFIKGIQYMITNGIIQV